MPNSGYFDTPFGIDGQLTVVPDPTQGSGAVSYQQGWGILYSTPVGSGGFNVARGTMNQILNDVTSAIQQYQQNGIPPFITSAMNGGSPFSYDQYATVLLDGIAYQSLINSNTDTPPSSNWVVFQVNNGLLDQVVTGASHTFITADNGFITRRSNSGAAMSDTLPGTSGALPVGWFGYVENVDSLAADTISVGSGGTINQGLNQGNIHVQPGEVWFIESRGAGVYNAWRAAGAVLAAAPLGGSSKNLAANVSSTTAFAMSADEFIAEDANGNTVKLSTVNVTVNSGTSGAGGLDTGSVANSTWYYGHIIFNPTTAVIAGLMSLSSIAPTLPSGYLYGGLASVQLTDGSAHFVSLQQYGKSVSFVPASVLTNGTAISLTAISLASCIPPIAKTCGGSCAYKGTTTVTVASSATNIGAMFFQANNVGAGISSAFNGLPILGSSQIFYEVSTTGSASLPILYINSFTF